MAKGGGNPFHVLLLSESSKSTGETDFWGEREANLLELVGGGALVAAAAEDPGQHGRGGRSTLAATAAAATGGERVGDRRAAQSNGKKGERKG